MFRSRLASLARANVLRPRTLGVLACTGVLALGASACGSGGSSSSSTNGSTKASNVTLGYVPVAIANPIIKAMADAVKLKTEALGMKYQQFGGAFDPQAQVQAVRAADASNVSILGVFPVDPHAIQGALDEARSQHIPLIVQASPQIRGVVTNIDTNDEDAAAQEAAYVADTLRRQGKPCKVGIIQGLQVVNILDLRNRGFAKGAQAAGCTILDQQVNQADTAAGARPIAAGWATKYGSQMTAILAYNDPTALGAISARSGSFQPLVVGINGDQEGLDAVRSGQLLSTMAEPVVEIGNTLAQVAYDTVVSRTAVPTTLWLKYAQIDSQTIKTHPTLAQQLASPMDVSWAREGDRYVVTATQK